MESRTPRAAVSKNQARASRPVTIFRLATGLWMLLIFFLSSQPRIPGASLFWGQDKIAHFIAFGLLGYLGARALRAPGGSRDRLRVLMPAVLTALYGVSDEIHQAFVPGRDAALTDVLADAVGAFFGALLAKRSS